MRQRSVQLAPQRSKRGLEAVQEREIDGEFAGKNCVGYGSFTGDWAGLRVGVGAGRGHGSAGGAE